MPLKERIYKDMVEAMKNKDNFKKNILSMVRAAILQVEKDTQKELDDEGVINVISKEIKQRKEVLPDYEKSGRQDLVDKAKKEIEIMLSYLPKQLSEEEIEEIVKKAIEETGAKTKSDIGKVMGKVMPIVKGRADGNLVKDMVNKYLQ